jgi:hypothetical protein
LQGFNDCRVGPEDKAVVDDSGVLSMAADDVPATNKTNSKAGTTAPLLQRRARALLSVRALVGFLCRASGLRVGFCMDPRFIKLIEMRLVLAP